MKGTGRIDRSIADIALKALNIDQFGLDEIDNKILVTIIDKFRGGPVGLETIAASISETRETIEDIYEPYLLQLGFIMRTPRGRIVTEAGYNHMNVPYPTANLLEPKLFDFED